MAGSDNPLLDPLPKNRTYNFDRIRLYTLFDFGQTVDYIQLSPTILGLALQSRPSPNPIRNAIPAQSV
jgi:hypothetical protein